MKVSKSGAFQASVRVFSGEVGIKAGWTMDRTKQVVTLSKTSELLLKFMESSVNASLKRVVVSLWDFHLPMNGLEQCWSH